ncbi:protein TSSC1 [Phthorimaea operculella]|nr:protein TSSC1 [Phthorimaea operculella]
MEEGNSIIYGLEHQTRALSPQYGEGEAIRFLIGTQSLKPGANQVHVVELEEDTGALHTKVFKHELGEIWHLRCSPHDAATLVTTHNAYDADAAQCYMGVSVYKLPTLDVIPKDLDDLSAIQGRNPEDMELLRTITPEKPEEEVRCAEWHCSEPSRLGVVYSTQLCVHDVSTGEVIARAKPEGRARAMGGKWSPHPPGQVRGGTDTYRNQGVVYSSQLCVLDVGTGEVAARAKPEGRARAMGGKWSPHPPGQFAILQDMHIKCYDTRTDCAQTAWSIDNAHRQLVRDVDFNPNRQFQLASVGDDAALNIWDYRNSKQPIFTRTDHSHWVWTVRYNTYHEQLILTGSSDARALLTAAASVCNDPNDSGTEHKLEDGVLQSYEQHEDSVYCCEWSAAEPWTFASLSYDARLVISRVPRHFKYKILL